MTERDKRERSIFKWSVLLLALATFFHSTFALLPMIGALYLLFALFTSIFKN